VRPGSEEGQFGLWDSLGMQTDTFRGRRHSGCLFVSVLMVLVVTMLVGVSHSLMRVLVTVLGPRSCLKLSYVGVLMM
jgi:hypothetical protein